MKQSNITDIKAVERWNESMLHQIGYQHTNNICAESEEFAEKYKNIPLSKNMDNWFEDFLETQDEEDVSSLAVSKSKFKVLTKVALFIISIGVVFSALAANVEAFKLPFLNIFVERNETFSEVSFDDATTLMSLEELEISWENYYYPTYLPDGYSFYDAYSTSQFKQMLFSDKENNLIMFYQCPTTSDFNIDTENATVEDVVINGKAGILSLTERTLFLVWTNDISNFYLKADIDKQELLTIAENIQKK